MNRDDVVHFARQTFYQCARLRLPEHQVNISFTTGNDHVLRERLLVAESRLFSPFGISIDASCHEVPVDVLLEAAEWQLGIIFVVTGSDPVPVDTERLVGRKAGLIALQLDDLLRVSQEHQEGTRQEAAQEILFNSRTNKQWLFHPRQARLVQQGVERLERMWNFKRLVPTNDPGLNESTGEAAVRKGMPVVFRCACGHRWKGPYGATVSCPACQQPAHLCAVIEKIGSGELK